MKLKRITSLLLCGLLTFGGVTETTLSVMASEKHSSLTDARKVKPTEEVDVSTAIEGKAIPKVAKSTTAKAAGDVYIDAINFPDYIFAINVFYNFDKNQDGILSQTERDNVTKINMGYASITSFKGVEFFPNLKEFLTARTDITSLDLSKNTKLTNITCINNTSLTKLTINKNPNLKELRCYGNKVTSLDLRNSKKLTYLDCDDNAIKTLKVPNSLKELRASKNQLSGVTGLSSCKNLTNLNLNNNLFVKLPSFKSCPKLRYVSFEKNYLTRAEILAKLPGSGSNSNKKWLTSQLKKQNKLAVPKSLKVATSGKKALAITWKKASNATGYEVYMSTKKNGTYKKVKTTAALSFTHKKLKKGTTYYYKIRSYRKIGKQTVYSNWSGIKSKKSK
jgi:Leucine-rich repeat (LRR) protein